MSEKRLPNGWKHTTLGEIGRYLNGYPFKPSDWSDSGRMIVRIQDLTGSGKSPNYFRGNVDPRYEIERGDLLISWAATLGAYIWRGEESVLNQHIFKVESYIDRTFHYYLALAVLDDLYRQAHGSGMVHVTKGKFDATAVDLPPLAEQRRIVAALEEHLSDLDAAVAGLERARANVRRFGAAIRDAAISGQLTNARVSNNGLPVSWSRKSFGEISEIQGGIQKQPKRAPVANHYPFLRVANVLRGRLQLDDVHRVELFGAELDRLRLRTGDLLIVEGNGSPGEIGRMAIWDGSIPDCVHQNHLIRARLNGAALPEFLAIYWNSPQGMRVIQSAASSTSGLHTLSVAKVSRIEIPLPPLIEQRAIVAEVERRLAIADRTAAEIDIQLARAARLRQSILKRAFEGKLVPQDPNDEPASALLERIRAERSRAPGPVGRRKRTRV